jgi:hypothetical protein
MSLWTAPSCGAIIAGDPTADDITVIPTMIEVCTLTRTVCDPLGCNEANLTLDIKCTTLANGFDTLAPSNLPMNECAIGCEPDPDLHECFVNGWDCGTGVNDCGLVENCGTGTCDDPAFPLCAMTAPDTGGVCSACTIVGNPCAGVACGTVDAPTTCPGVTTPVVCGTCTLPQVCNEDPDPTLNYCADPLIWRCIAINYGADACVDFLQADGWDAATAQPVCVSSSPDAPAVIEVCDEFVDCCKALAPTRTPYRWVKRCVATWVATDVPAPHEPYYVYLPNFFPDQVCFDNLGGTLEIEPTGVFPAY